MSFQLFNFKAKPQRDVNLYKENNSVRAESWLKISKPDADDALFYFNQGIIRRKTGTLR